MINMYTQTQYNTKEETFYAEMKVLRFTALNPKHLPTYKWWFEGPKY